MTAKNNAPAGTEAANTKTQNISRQNHTTKQSRVLFALGLSQGLNRFQAENIGDHCLNSTISTLRKKGYSIISRPEKVPSRFTDKGVTVSRYWLLSARGDA